MADWPYVHDPIETDPDALETAAYEYLQTKFPGWVPNDSNLEPWFIGGLALMLSEASDVASDVPPEIMRYLGQNLFGIPSTPATSAVADSTWATPSAAVAPISIPAGSLISLTGADGEPVFFETIVEETIAAGTTEVTGVTVRAVDENIGESGNSLGGVGVVADPVDVPALVSTVTMEGLTTGGTDKESIDDYLDRLSSRLVLLAPRPILPEDYSLLARDLAAQRGVDARVVAVDGYDPVANTSDNERMITVSMVDAETNANIPGATLTEIDDELQALREINFIVHVVDPDRTTIDVNFTVVPRSGYDGATAASDGEAAIESFFDTWGQPPDTEGSTWEPLSVVRHQDLSTVLNNTPSISHWTVLEMRTGADPFADNDITLSGGSPIAVADAGVITGTAG